MFPFRPREQRSFSYFLFLFIHVKFISDDSIDDNDDNSTDKNEDERNSATSYDEDVSDNSTDSPYQQNEEVSNGRFINTITPDVFHWN